MPKLPPLVLPGGTAMPLPYRWLHAHGVVELRPWSFIDNQKSALGLRDQFLVETTPPNPSNIRDWMPFARHQAQDDFAGFVLRDGAATGEVAVVHLTWSRGPEQPGWPSLHMYADGWEWIERCLLPDTKEWAELNYEEDIATLLEDA